jgi:iron(III) transport system substrate-binding protein
MMKRFSGRFAARALLSAAACAVAVAATAEAAEVNIYSYRQEFLIRPFLDRFTEETGIKVNVVFAETGMAERLKAEGMNSPADLVLTVDIARLDELTEAGVLQPVTTSTLTANVPESYRHPEGLWYGLTKRARLIFASKERVPEGTITTYEELADPKWRGKICMRSAKHVYNRALLAAMIAAHGEEKAKQWAAGLKDNQARKPQGSDRSQVKAVMEGACDLALGNNYYYGLMKFNDEQPEQKEWAASVYPIFPNQDGRGTHVNISGVGLTKASKNRDAAIRLMEFLSGDEAQRMYAAQNFEYPVKVGVPWNEEVASWSGGAFKTDSVSLQKIAELSPVAVKIFNEVGFE